MVLKYDGTENGFFSACFYCFERGVLPTRILRGNRATAPKKTVTEIVTSKNRANAFRLKLKEVHPDRLCEICLALRRQEEGTPLTVMRYAFYCLTEKNPDAESAQKQGIPLAQLLQKVRLELYRYGGILRFSPKNGGIYAETQPIDDVVDLLLLHTAQTKKPPIYICDTLRNKTAVLQENFQILSAEGTEILQEENASFYSLNAYLAPPKKLPEVSQLCFFSEPLPMKGHRPYLTMKGTFKPRKYRDIDYL